jgi:hypothetical protein
MDDKYKNYTKVIVAGSRIKSDSNYGRSYHDMSKQAHFHKNIFLPNLEQWFWEHDYIDDECKYNKAWQTKNKLVFVSGMALSGGDYSIVKFCNDHDLDYVSMPANWELGKKAGFLRNKQMIEYATANNQPAHLICFYDGVSKGTKSIIDLAKQNKYISLCVVDIDI